MKDGCSGPRAAVLRNWPNGIRRYEKALGLKWGYHLRVSILGILLDSYPTIEETGACGISETLNGLRKSAFRAEKAPRPLHS